jgi:transcriptional antiterminator Rof (Rho-off)
MASIRKPSRPPPAEPYHVAVDLQLKSGHQTYEAAEKAALRIKNRYPQLHVSVFDAKEGRHKLIELSKLASASNNNRGTARAAVNRRNAAAG